ncbi:hypothetical protein THAOC_17389 [Thalassiosira oceanica]|uniref:Uncharacterized protein n=1 Tax=Thalassiosira oceanica TaxID=159749 RepID=K0S797_THAOC|nr:hypothetical protein THAOC_17389 [Thalassiosira oceanica]|eukprot:EJK62018.1 hypothetical protein THAOC_17389 [Thalassiosira oceanica]
MGGGRLGQRTWDRDVDAWAEDGDAVVDGAVGGGSGCGCLTRLTGWPGRAASCGGWSAGGVAVGMVRSVVAQKRDTGHDARRCEARGRAAPLGGAPACGDCQRRAEVRYEAAATRRGDVDVPGNSRRRFYVDADVLSRCDAQFRLTNVLDAGLVTEALTIFLGGWERRHRLY